MATRLTANIPLRIAGIGDSIMVGEFATVKSNSWLEKVIAQLTTDGYLVNSTSFAVPGATTQNHLDWRTYDKVNSISPHVIFLALGTNDYGSLGANDTNANDKAIIFQTSLQSLVNKLSSDLNRNPFICFVTTWGADSGRVAFDNVIKTVSLSYGNSVVADMRPTIVAHYNDGSRAASGIQTFMGTADGWHPGNVGHNYYYQTVYSAIQGKLPIATRVAAGRL
ncbi:MAG TPA: SGNH/GDSL hydrolase family protein [Clostridia bacterium]